MVKIEPDMDVDTNVIAKTEPFAASFPDREPTDESSSHHHHYQQHPLYAGQASVAASAPSSSSLSFTNSFPLSSSPISLSMDDAVRLASVTPGVIPLQRDPNMDYRDANTILEMQKRCQITGGLIRLIYRLHRGVLDQKLRDGWANSLPLAPGYGYQIDGMDVREIPLWGMEKEAEAWEYIFRMVYNTEAFTNSSSGNLAANIDLDMLHTALHICRQHYFANIYNRIAAIIRGLVPTPGASAPEIALWVSMNRYGRAQYNGFDFSQSEKAWISAMLKLLRIGKEEGMQDVLLTVSYIISVYFQENSIQQHLYTISTSLNEPLLNAVNRILIQGRHALFQVAQHRLLDRIRNERSITARLVRQRCAKTDTNNEAEKLCDDVAATVIAPKRCDGDVICASAWRALYVKYADEASLHGAVASFLRGEMSVVSLGEIHMCSHCTQVFESLLVEVFAALWQDSSRIFL